MVSTVASGNVGPFVGPTDITMMHSVTDIAGINHISRRVLANAAHAIVGMATHRAPSAEDDKPAVGLTMFGVTTPLVIALVDSLQDEYEPLVFHATGTGGRSMEKLVESEMLVAVLDMTTTEIADEVVGGILSAGPDRMDAIARAGIPYVGSVGALDMANFGALDTVPEPFRDRNLYVHNSATTLMRTTPEENRRIGEFIATKLNTMTGPARFLLPEFGVSLIDAPGQPFYDPEADRILLDTIEAGVTAPKRRGPTHARQHQRSRVCRRDACGVFRSDGGTTMSRAEILARFQSMVERREPIVGGGAGTGLSAKWEEAGGIDLIIIYNSGRYRMAGRGSLAGLLAYGNANEIVLDMAKEVLPVVKHTPVLAGVNGTDPFYMPESFMRQLVDIGFAGVQNFPTVGLIDGVFRQNLEETGMSYQLEVEMIRKAHEADLLTTPYVFSARNAVDMAEAGADIIVCHMGLTTGGSIGAETAKTLDDCVVLIDEWTDAARSVREDVIILVHGGPIAMPEDAAYVLKHAKGVNGFYGASSMERLPTEQALQSQTEAFKAVTF